MFLVQLAIKNLEFYNYLWYLNVKKSKKNSQTSMKFCKCILSWKCKEFFWTFVIFYKKLIFSMTDMFSLSPSLGFFNYNFYIFFYGLFLTFFRTESWLVILYCFYIKNKAITFFFKIKIDIFLKTFFPYWKNKNKKIFISYYITEKSLL